MQPIRKDSKGLGKRTASEADSDSHSSSPKSVREGAADIKKLRITSGIAKLIFGPDVERVQLDAVRSSNAKAHRIHGLVAVFVGGTDGIGKTTAIELFRRTTSPKAYIVGRNAEKGNRLINELKSINSAGEAVFLQKDIAILRHVDELCHELMQREVKVNCLFLTAGSMSLKGREETAEGLDKKMSTNYYARIRWAVKLMPLLTAASGAGELSRVVNVLAAGSEADILLEDLDLRDNFSLHACMAHCVVMTDFMMDELAKRFPNTSFSHSYPGNVKTGLANELNGSVRLAIKIMYAVTSPWILNVKESGERHLFQITSKCYPAATPGRAGVAIPEGLAVMRGIDGRIGSGAYLLDWDGRAITGDKILDKYKAMDVGKLIWDHTMQMFDQATQKQQLPRNMQSTASELRSQQKRAQGDPVGWRPA